MIEDDNMKNKNVDVDGDENILYNDDPFYTWLTIVFFGVYYYIVLANISDVGRYLSSNIVDVSFDVCVTALFSLALVGHLLVFCFLTRTFK
jgi:hypothetical protein